MLGAVRFDDAKHASAINRPIGVRVIGLGELQAAVFVELEVFVVLVDADATASAGVSTATTVFVLVLAGLKAIGLAFNVVPVSTTVRQVFNFGLIVNAVAVDQDEIFRIDLSHEFCVLRLASR